jgi:hypothetical protein
LEIVLILTQDRCLVLRLTYQRIENHFGDTGWSSWVTRLKWKLISVWLEVVLFLTQDRCTFKPNVP